MPDAVTSGESSISMVQGTQKKAAAALAVANPRNTALADRDCVENTRSRAPNNAVPRYRADDTANARRSELGSWLRVNPPADELIVRLSVSPPTTSAISA